MVFDLLELVGGQVEAFNVVTEPFEGDLDSLALVLGRGGHGGDYVGYWVVSGFEVAIVLGLDVLVQVYVHSGVQVTFVEGFSHGSSEAAS